jgi:amino acid adenylation domain-containing protein/non-ribosomal peptide synthase protein (TIGR01720 family)
MTQAAPVVTDSYALSPTQAGMLYHAISEARTGVDIEQIVITLRERIDEPVFIRSWNEVVQRHAILRTRFRWEGIPEFRQEVVDHAELPVTHADWRLLEPAEKQKRIAAQLAADRREDFDLTRAPAMRLFIARLGTDDYQVIWTFHHALLDGRSFPGVLREVFDIHAALQRGETAQLCEPRAYREYIDGHRSLDLNGAQAYWREVLLGFHAATPFNVDVPASAALPTAPTGDPAGDPTGAMQERLSRQVTAALRGRANAIGVTLNTLLQGAWALLLHRYSGESDIVFGATRAGRTTGQGSGDGQVGLFINTLPVRVKVDDDNDVVAWLRDLREQQIRMRPFGHAPLVKVQSWSSVARGKPLFESLVVYDHESLEARLHALGSAWETRHFEYIGQTAYPLAVIAYGDPEMLVRLEYSRRRFADDSIERMLGHLVTLLEGLARGEARQLKELTLLKAAERAALLAGPEASRTYPRGPALHELFERQVERRPEAIALTAFGADDARFELTYAELNRRANRVAHRLRASGVVPNQLVGLRTERNAELVIGILAILKSGGAYLPLDPVYPKERVAFMLEDSRAAIVLTQTSLKAGLAGLDATLICLDEPVDAGPEADANPSPASGADDLAYVIYTSGSTGKPKGVLITHHNVARLFAATDPWYGFGERDVWTLFHSYAFDFSVWELWGALLYGGRLVTVSLDISRSTDAFRELLLREGVTVLNQTPTAFRQLIDADAAQPQCAFALRYVIFGGEALELQSLKPWFERHGDVSPRLINMYGITETTVHVTYRPITLADLDAGAGSVIGVPIPDLKIYLLDPQGEPAPIGVPAEIYVSGAGVGRGYLNRPELSAQRFVRDPFDADPNARMYRSGDLARRLDNGDVEYLGRIDQQVKIRGFRIELGEIEARIAQHPQVRQVAVVAREDVAGDKRLVAYLVAAGQDSPVVEQLRQSIRAVMPDYMMPAHFVFLPALPLTQNGKLDRLALPVPAVSRADPAKPFIAPRNAAEQAIAAVWQAVLRIDRVSVDDHFFELGGDSILSIQVIARCRQQGLQFTPKDLFNRPTIAQLAQVVRAAPSMAKAPSEPVGGEVPLTPIQVWFFEQRFTHPQHWNQAFMFEVPADLDVQALEAALRGLLSRHDALRMRYQQDAAGRWLQRYGTDDSSLRLGRIDLSDVARDEQAAAIEGAAAAEQATFNLETGPLVRAVHFHLGPELRGRVLLAVHHLVVDGVSWRVLREDLESLYFAAAGSASSALPEKTSSLQTWSKALHEHARSAAGQSSFAHWHALAARPVLNLPHHAAGQSPFAAEGKLITQLSREDTRALLQRLPAVFQTQINDALLTALARALQRGTGSRTLSIDLEGHGREHLTDGVDVSRTVGWFTTLFPIALDVEPGADAVDTLLSVKDQLQRIPDRGLSWGLLRYLASDAAVRNGLASMPASPVLFNYLGQFDAVVADSALFSFAAESTGPWRSPHARRTHALEIVAVVRNGQLEIAWHHDADAQHEASIAQLASDMVAGLRELIAHAQPSRRRAPTPADFPLAGLDAASLARLVSRYPQLDDIYPLTPMQRLFFAMETSQAHLGFEQWHFRLDGAVEPALLRRAIEQVIERHSMLRTAFVADGGAEPLQLVSAGATLPWSQEDWRAWPAAEQSGQLSALLASDARVSFDLAQAPLMRVALRRVADESYHFVWSTHHLYIDGWSWPIVFRDVSQAYAALEADKAPWLEEALPFKSYVKWLSDAAPDSQDFWKTQLADFSAPTPFVLSAPTADPAAADAAEPFAEVLSRLPVAMTSALQAFARGAHVTLSAMFNGAWSLLLAHYSGARSVVFGAALSGRPSEIEGIESLVGPCVNNLPVRVDVEPALALKPWLAEIQQRQFDIAQHQYAPLERIQQWAGIAWRHRLFDSLVVFQNYQVDAGARSIGADIRSTLICAPEATNYLLTITVSVEQELRLRLIYKPGALARADVEQFAADLSTVLSAMVSSSAATIGDILGVLPAGSRGKAHEFGSARSVLRRSAFSAPSTEAELEIAAVWQDLFGVERVSLDDNFFDLGGHSVLLVQAHARLKARLRADLAIVALLQYPTVRSLAHYLSGGADADRQKAASVTMDRAQKQREAQMRQRSLAGKQRST